MKDIIIAKRYAKAFFQIAEEKGASAKIYDELNGISEIIEQSREWMETMQNQRVPAFVKSCIVGEICEKEKISDEITNGLKLLLEKGHIEMIPQITELYKKMFFESQGKTQAKVFISSDEIWERLKEEIIGTIEEITGKKAEVEHVIDKKIIGGIIIKIGNLIYDGSINAELNRMKESMLSRTSEI